MDKVDKLDAASALARMAEHEKDAEIDEKDPGLYDKRRNVKFPVKLMQILDDEKYNSIIAWTPDGKAFAILKPTILEQEVLPAVFENKQHGNSKFKSFLRKLYRWGFLKKFHQSDDFTYYHKSFQKGNLALCLTITRLPNIKKAKSSSNAENDSNGSILSNDVTSGTQQQLQQLLAANSIGFPGSNPLLTMAAATGGIPPLNHLNTVVAAQTDAAILNVLKQKILINDLMMTSSSPASIRNNSSLLTANHDATSSSASSRQPPLSGGTTPATMETVLAGTVCNTPVSSTSSLLDTSNHALLFPGGGSSSSVLAAALQHGRNSAAGAARGNNNFNSLNDIESQLLRQKRLENELLLGLTMGHTPGSAHSAGATAASLLGGTAAVNNNFGGLSNPAITSALLSQSRYDQRTIGGEGQHSRVNPFSSVTAATGGVLADSLTNAGLLGSAGLSGGGSISQQQFLLNKYRNDLDTMNDVTVEEQLANHHQNLLSSSLGASGSFGREQLHHRQYRHSPLSSHPASLRKATPPPVKKRGDDASYDGRRSASSVSSPPPHVRSTNDSSSRIDINASCISSSPYERNNRNVGDQQKVSSCQPIAHHHHHAAAAAGGRDGHLNHLIQRKKFLDCIEHENRNRDQINNNSNINMRYKHDNHHPSSHYNRRPY